MKQISEYSRLFTFGCSFTQYHWPTWADILGQEAQEFQNWGKSGAGNDYILNRLMECHQRQQINNRDLVIIMWSGVAREDHYYNGFWHLNGNIYTANSNRKNEPYSPEWLEQYRSNDGYLIKSLNYITAAKLALDAIGCDYYFLSMLPIGEIEFQSSIQPNNNIVDVYKSTLAKIKPSIFESLYNSDWMSLPMTVKLRWPGQKEARGDPHPTPQRHLEYLIKSLPDLRLSKRTKNFVEQWNQRVVNLSSEDHAKIIDPDKNGRLYPMPNLNSF